MSGRRIAFLGFLAFLFSFVALAQRWWGAALVLLAIALVLPWPPLFMTASDGTKVTRPEYLPLRRWMTGLAIALVPAAFLAVGLSKPDTPEDRAAAEEREHERRLEDAREAARERTEDAMDAARERAEKVAEEAEREKERAFGLHCASGWDGAYRPLVQAVEPELRNPDSFDHVETRFSRVDEDGNHRVIMTFRAENGFGGLNLSTAYALVRGEDCAMLSWEFG